MLKNLRARVHDELNTMPAAKAALSPEPVANVAVPPEHRSEPPVSIPAAQLSLDLLGLQSALGTLDDEQLLLVLGQLPAYQLARALERLLNPVTNAPAQQTQSAHGPADLRNAERSKTLRAGKIIYNNKMSVNDCHIRDISDTGCRVSLESVAGIPNHFTLHIINSDTKHECEVAWRKSNMMGLKFIG